jgi:hypothetical protein
MFSTGPLSVENYLTSRASPTDTKGNISLPSAQTIFIGKTLRSSPPTRLCGLLSYLLPLLWRETVRASVPAL